MTRPSALTAALSRASLAPSLLLSLGAFLLVASGAAFAQLTGVPLTAKFVMLSAATALLGAAGHALRARRHLDVAGSAFMAAAALLVPIDLALLVYKLVDIPKISVELLLAAGSLLAAGLHAALAAAGHGRAFAYLFLLFALHGVARIVHHLGARAEWYVVATAVALLALEVAGAALLGERSRRVLGPLAPPIRALAATSVLLGAWWHARWLTSPRDPFALGPQALLWLAVALTLYYAVRSRSGDRSERSLAAAGPLVAYYAVVRSVTVPTLEFVAVPVGVYLIAAAAWAERGLHIAIAPRDRENLAALGSTLVLTPLVAFPLDTLGTARALVESLAVLITGAAMARPRVALVGALSVGILAIRLVAGGLSAFAPWMVFALAGLTLLGLGAFLARSAAAERSNAQPAAEE